MVVPCEEHGADHGQHGICCYRYVTGVRSEAVECQPAGGSNRHKPESAGDEDARNEYYFCDDEQQSENREGYDKCHLNL